MRANLSIMGLYYEDPTILDPMAPQLPKDDDNAPLLDFNVLRSNILVECAEIEIVYPEPDTFKIALEAWSYTREHEWQRMYDALMEDYNALHNYDRHEQIDRTYTPGAGYSDTLSNPGYNSGTMVTAGETTHTPDGESDIDSVTNHMYGNIGVTTSAQMLLGELEARKTDIYKIITDEFRKRFCLLIY